MRALAHASAGTQATTCDSSSSPRSPRPLLVLGSARCSPKKLSCLLLKRMVYCASCLRATTYRLIDMGFGFWEGTGLIVFLEDRGLACFRMRGPDCFSRNRPPCQGEPVSERVSCQGVPCQGGPVSERAPCQGGPVPERARARTYCPFCVPPKAPPPTCESREKPLVRIFCETHPSRHRFPRSQNSALKKCALNWFRGAETRARHARAYLFRRSSVSPESDSR